MLTNERVCRAGSQLWLQLCMRARMREIASWRAQPSLASESHSSLLSPEEP